MMDYFVLRFSCWESILLWIIKGNQKVSCAPDDYNTETGTQRLFDQPVYEKKLIQCKSVLKNCGNPNKPQFMII
jgi:hypothetical protein